ncbi:hypothetical protein [Paucibacter sp. DJ2R-2]|uniref:hypothetical protein n=1 Tax=Paucibacter sp. DJ2R-2 TaxID=2893558 RepID=UPI0021E37F33|nr:hypothetical protein [Paucibacter sp. DJ2R-2]MCV2419336.1 hypothetical protein [Paucibacter sp. DJ4R-1]MCV2437760.1 hypothetical protein [Paucibacter sp. DJ2R-2]
MRWNLRNPTISRSPFTAAWLAASLAVSCPAWSATATGCVTINKDVIQDVSIEARPEAANCFELSFQAPPGGIHYLIQAHPPRALTFLAWRPLSDPSQVDFSVQTNADGTASASFTGEASRVHFAVRPEESHGRILRATVTTGVHDGFAVVYINVGGP